MTAKALPGDLSASVKNRLVRKGCRTLRTLRAAIAMKPKRYTRATQSGSSLHQRHTRGRVQIVQDRLGHCDIFLDCLLLFSTNPLSLRHSLRKVFTHVVGLEVRFGDDPM